MEVMLPITIARAIPGTPSNYHNSQSYPQETRLLTSCVWLPTNLISGQNKIYSFYIIAQDSLWLLKLVG